MKRHLLYLGAVYRLAAQPQFKPQTEPKTQHPTGGPRLSREQFAALGQLSREDFDQIADVIADKMVQLCTQQYVNAENWCIAANGQTMGWYHDQETALGVAKHWLFLKSLRPDADIKVGRTRKVDRVDKSAVKRATGGIMKSATPNTVLFRGSLYRLAAPSDPVLKPLGALPRFTGAYLDAAMADSPDIGHVDSLSPSKLHQIKLDCDKFQKRHRDIVEMMGPERAAYNFWVTRNDPRKGFAAQPLPPHMQAAVLDTCAAMGPFDLKDPRWGQDGRMWQYEPGDDYR